VKGSNLTLFQSKVSLSRGVDSNAR
jgi:hypothetical protein